MCVTRRQRNLEPDFLDDVRDRSLQQRELHVVGQPPQVELLPEPHGAERVDAGAIGLPVPQQREARAAAADLGQQRPRAAKRRAAAERLPHGEEHQPALLRFVDDLEGDPRAALDPIEEHVAVARFAHRAGRDGAQVLNAVAVDHAAEILERRERRVDRLRSNDAGREGVAAEQDASRRFLDRANGPVRRRSRRRRGESRSRPCRGPPRAPATTRACRRSRGDRG